MCLGLLFLTTPMSALTMVVSVCHFYICWTVYYVVVFCLCKSVIFLEFNYHEVFLVMSIFKEGIYQYFIQMSIFRNLFYLNREITLESVPGINQYLAMMVKFLFQINNRFPWCGWKLRLTMQLRVRQAEHCFMPPLNNSHNRLELIILYL